jgi:hypothetical protein
VVTDGLEVYASSIFRGYLDGGRRFYFAVLVTTYISTWCHNPEYHYLNISIMNKI